MSPVAKELLALDRQRLDPRAGAVGVAVLAVLAVAIAFVGTEAMAAVVGALVVLAADPPPAGRPRATALLPLVLGGAALTFLAVWTGDRPVPAALLAGAVGTATALHAGRSRRAAIRGLVATTWVIIAFTLHDTGTTPLGYAVAFAVGGVAGAGVARARRGSAEGVEADDVEEPTAPDPDRERRSLLPSPLGRFAVLRPRRRHRLRRPRDHRGPHPRQEL